MTDADWLREGTHTEVGRYGAERWLEIYAEHAHRHARQIRVARDAARRTPSRVSVEQERSAAARRNAVLVATPTIAISESTSLPPASIVVRSRSEP